MALVCQILRGTQSERGDFKRTIGRQGFRRHHPPEGKNER
jgi:hypothetical protein